MCLTRMEELESCLSGLLSTLKKNREHVPLEVLKTQYKQPYEELVRNINLTASAYAKSVLLHRLVLNPDADVEEQCTVINQMIQTSGMLCGWEKEKNMAFVIELLLIGVGLSMDAFAVAVCKGLAMRKVNKKQAVVIGLFFGGFQALMPFIGWALGTQFESYITSIDHWIAFILLALIGGKMVVEGYRLEEDETVKELDPPLDMKEMFLLAIATSIDALAVGITFAFLNYPIVECITIIGLTTFVLSIVGVVVGNMFGSRYQKKAEIAGGIILILIGLKILLEHLGILVL